MDEDSAIRDELVQIVRLAATGTDADVRLYAGRLARRYRTQDPELARELTAALKVRSSLRPERLANASAPSATAAGSDGSLSVLRTTFPGNRTTEAPVFSPDLESQLIRLLKERGRARELEEHGLRAISSAVFVGPPGVGKTRSAQWIASELDLPLFSLDLTAVMSSRLGQSGANLRFALDRAKSEPSVLFLDEIDAIAKRRDDESDVGELKRLVTIMLQELDEWPTTSLLLAATNHPDLVDPAIWRRFDMKVTFGNPEGEALDAAIERFLGGDEALAEYAAVFRTLFSGESYSEIERQLLGMRKARILGDDSAGQIIAQTLSEHTGGLTRDERVRLATALTGPGMLSQRQASEILGVSRDTIRKHARGSAAAVVSR